MTLTETRQRPTVGTRRAGYVVAVLVNLIMLFAINVWPGWQVLPFLTAEITLVLWLINASIAVNVVANLVYLIGDPAWLKALGDMLTTAVGILALARLWQVFPFDFSSYAFDWSIVVHILLGVGIIGSAIGIFVAFFSFIKSVANS